MNIWVQKNSLAAVCRISAYAFSILALLLISSISALANNCDTQATKINPATLAHSGIGGTGAPQSGIGGTGLYDGGIGGTGNQESGIGGTGNVADDGGIGGTGIIGTITGFASICVNGVEIHYDTNTPVSVDGRLSTIRDLAVGQVIAVRALGTGHELKASNIAIIHAAVGPIGDLNLETGKMYVLGQTIQTEFSKDHSHFPNFKTGDWVQVSGHRLSNGTIVASHIESVPPLADARINGHVTQIGANSFEVNGTRINHDAKLLPVGITQGMEIRVTGHWDGASLQARQIQTEPTRESIGNVAHVVIEGYIHALSGKELNLNHQIVTLDPNTQIVTGNVRSDLRLDQRIQISGRVGTDQRVNADRIESKQELPIQIQERSHRIPIDGINGDRRNNSDTDSGKGSGGNLDSRSGHGGDSGKDSLKKVESGDSSGSNSRSNGSSDSVKNESKPDHSGSSGREQKERSQDNRQQNSADHKSIDKPENPKESDILDRSNNNLRDVETRSDQRDSQPNIDIPDRVRDHGGQSDRYIDR